MCLSHYSLYLCLKRSDYCRFLSLPVRFEDSPRSEPFASSEILPDSDIRCREGPLPLLPVSHPAGDMLDPFVAPAVGRVLDSGTVFGGFGRCPDAPAAPSRVLFEGRAGSAPEIQNRGPDGLAQDLPLLLRGGLPVELLHVLQELVEKFLQLPLIIPDVDITHSR